MTIMKETIVVSMFQIKNDFEDRTIWFDDEILISGNKSNL
jgi:hypothetical protein